MCGRYCLAPEDGAELAALIAQAQRRLGATDDGATLKVGEIFPSELVPVIANNRRLEPTTFAMKWGYARPGGKGLIINARSETAADKAMFRDGMQNRRCLIPASHYFEWTHGADAKVKYGIRPHGAQAIYMAGLYRLEGTRPAFVILTRAASASIAFVHDRMPVLLPKSVARAWLDKRNPAHEVLRAALVDMAAEPVDAQN